MDELNLFLDEEDILLLDEEHNLLLDEEHNQGRGRNIQPFTRILSNFFTPSGRNPRRKKFNAFIMRSIIRLIRYISEYKIPKRSAIAVDVTEDAQIRIWLQLIEIYDAGYVRLPAIIDIRKDSTKSGCALFFISEGRREIFYLLIELMFSNCNPTKLRLKFRLNCCVENEHGQHCNAKWDELKEYLMSNYLADLDQSLEIDYLI